MAAKVDNLRYLLYFFDRPTAPIFIPRGLHGTVYFKVPPSYYPELYKNIIEDDVQAITFVQSAPNVEIINVPELDPKYHFDLTIPKKLEKRAAFSVFDPFHQACAAILIQYLLDCPAEQLLSACVKISLDDMNPYLFNYALSVALVHRDDTKHLPIPSPISHSPEFYLYHDTIQNALDESSIHYIDLKPTATDAEIENRVAYFREDIGINIHHWHWHVVYPFSVAGPNAEKIVAKDRRGELFYYMHQQILGRYNIERLCNKLARAESLAYFREEIPQAYFPKLANPYTKDTWANRPINAKLSNVKRDVFNVTILDMELWRDRILNAIHSGYVYEKDRILQIPKTVEGMDWIGNIVEASILSKNQLFYGNLHNMGHILIAFSHDPYKKYLEGIGVMGDNRTAMRDPLFYRWHSFIDDIFQEYKKTLPSYTRENLTFKEVSITSFKVITAAAPNLNIDKPLENKLITYTQTDLVNLSHGLDIKNPGYLYLRFSHLQHKDFEYQLQVKNDGEEKKATVRIFLAPTKDEKGIEYTNTDPAFPLNEQRRFFIELDKFVVTLKAKSTTSVTRSSGDSSVTIPFKQMFADIDQVLKDLDDSKPGEAGDLAYCGCGWPHYMLIPKGTLSGYSCHLFAMLTDYKEDEVKEDSNESVDPEKIYGTKRQDCKCSDMVTSASFCGLKNKKYPDSRPMGYPFDRPIERGVRSIYDFLTDNMKVVEVTIQHLSNVIDGETVGKVEVAKAQQKRC